ncbi:MAG: hypothetical protein V4450_14795 [Bacteroidota bacterium]
MKRSLIAILAILYFTISSGVVVNIHYCMGKMSSVKLQSYSGNGCTICGKKTAPGKCCKTESKLIKLEDAQKASYADYVLQTPVTVVTNDLNLLQTPFYNAADRVLPAGHSPPLLSQQDTYLRNCVFRI